MDTQLLIKILLTVGALWLLLSLGLFIFMARFFSQLKKKHHRIGLEMGEE